MRERHYFSNPNSTGQLILLLKSNVSAFRTEILLLWAVSLGVGAVILGTFALLNPQDIDNGALAFLTVPHDQCPLCGMSHSLSFMTRGHVGQAFSWNAGGPFLYAGILLNSVVALTTSAIWLVRRKPGRRN
ncbi:MAG: DUF2752 domain-containing protein [Dehalococcoidia bacterium]